MAKQIYIDENGNPISVSGTINNASMLPISGNDSTDTKTYIDTGLSGKADNSDINNLYVVGTTDYTVTSALTVPANGYKEIIEMANAIPSGAIFLDASIPNNNGGYLFFQIGYYGKYYIIARNFSGSAVTINANQIVSIRYMYKPNLT